MSPDNVSLKCSTRSKDEIPFDLTATVTLKVRDDPAAISRVALDGLQASMIETRLVLDQVHRAILSIISSVTYADIPDLSTVQNRVEQEMAKEGRSGAAFAFLSVTLTSVVSSDPQVRERQLGLLKAKLRVAQYQEEEILESRIRDFKRQQDLFDLEARKKVREAEREHERQLGSDQAELEKKRHDREMERLRLDADTKIKIATIHEQAEVAKVQQLHVREMMQYMVRAAEKEARTKLMEGIITRSHEVLLNPGEELPPNSGAGPSTTEAPKDEDPPPTSGTGPFTPEPPKGP